MRDELGAVIVAVVAIVIAAWLGDFAPHYNPYEAPYARCTTVTFGTAACPGSTSAASPLPAAQRKTR
jgi:hypothetical protein